MNKKLKIFLLLDLGMFEILAIAYILAAFVTLYLLIAFCLLDN